jgi:hypothetical protein
VYQFRHARVNGAMRVAIDTRRAPRLYGRPCMAEEHVILTHPARDKPVAKATKAVVMLLLLASAALVLIVTLGGWDTLAGLKIIAILYAAVYLVMAFYVARWNRGVLPVAAALAIIMAIFALVSGPQWFDRDKAGFTDPTLNEDVLGLITLLIVPVQILLIAFSMRGFSQEWNVEVEQRVDSQGRPVGRSAPATA